MLYFPITPCLIRCSSAIPVLVITPWTFANRHRGLRDYDANLDTANLDNLISPARQGFVAVEWGGMSLNRD